MLKKKSNSLQQRPLLENSCSLPIRIRRILYGDAVYYHQLATFNYFCMAKVNGKVKDRTGGYRLVTVSDRLVPHGAPETF